MTQIIKPFDWSKIVLQEPPTIERNPLYQCLLNITLEEKEAEAGSKKVIIYLQQTKENACLFSLNVTDIWARASDEKRRFDQGKALANLQALVTGEQSTIGRALLFYAPWLLTHFCCKPKPDAMLQGILLARLTELFLAAMEEADQTSGRYADSYALLRRAHFLLLAALTQRPESNATEYWPDLAIRTQSAWHAWAQLLLDEPVRIRRLLVENGCPWDSEGAFLFFADEERTSVWNFATDEQQRAFTDEIMTRWFLPRYDLTSVQCAVLVLGKTEDNSSNQISATTPSRRQQARQTLHKLLHGWIKQIAAWQAWETRVTLGLLGLPLAVGTATAFDFSRWPWVHESWLVGITFYLRWVLPLAGLALLALMGLRMITLGVDLLRFSLPRVTLTIVVGYLALITSGEVLGAALSLYANYFLLTWAVVAACSAAAFGALYLEIRPKVSWREAALARRRTGAVLMQATVRTLAIGWLILAPLGHLLLLGNPALDSAQPWYWWGGWPVYPHLILLLAPLALFAGIFLQTIWEENKITRPL